MTPNTSFQQNLRILCVCNFKTKSSIFIKRELWRVRWQFLAIREQPLNFALMKTKNMGHGKKENLSSDFI